MATFELLDEQGNVIGTYTGKQPRRAALKAAGKGYKDIILREVGSGNGKFATRLHRFTGHTEPAPFALPYPPWIKTIVEKEAGKPIPHELNAKGKEDELKNAGFKPHIFDKSNVQKVGVLKVPKIKGADMHIALAEFLKHLPAVTAG